jgi:predicted PurR-regulated permease PerM
MENERDTDRLARYIIRLGALAIVAFLCWYFRSVLVYIIAAFVVSLIGHPLIGLLRKVTVKGKTAPDWLLSAVTIVIIIGAFILVVTQVVPIVTGIVSDATLLDWHSVSVKNPLTAINGWLIERFPSLGSDFDIFVILTDKLKGITSFDNVTGLIGSVTSMVSGIVVALFSVIFISFFFIKDRSLFSRIVCALVSDRIEESVGRTINEIEQLLSRYFVGLLVEMLGVALIDLIGLWLIARLGFSYALGIAVIAGLLNIIPYVGPLVGELVGAVLAVIIKMGTGAGLDVNLWAFAGIVLLIMLTAQLIDNFIYQPVIYSTSIKASPLEIFVVLLVAGRIGGIAGMFLAIPAYTVLRVIASRFFYRYKPIKRLIPDLQKEDSILNL